MCCIGTKRLQISHKSSKAVVVLFQRDDGITNSNRAQCERGPAGGGERGAIVLRHGTKQLGQCVSWNRNIKKVEKAKKNILC